MMTNKPRLERLQLTNFRGATTPTVFHFRADYPIILIFGENGAGKSTIADAIDFVCNNDFGSLRLRSGVRAATHIVAADRDARGLAVEMDYGGASWRATLRGSKSVTTPSNPPRAFVMRRADITRIMEATDSERYKSLREFITAPHIERAENTLRAASRTVAAELKDALQQKGAAEATLQQIWTAEGRPGDNFLAWARGVVQQPVAELEAQIVADRALLHALDLTAEGDQRVMVQAEKLARMRQKYMTINQKLRVVSKNQTDADRAEILQAAYDYLHAHADADRCPVCAKPEPRAALLARLDAQLTQLQEVQHLRQQLEAKLDEGQQLKGAYDTTVDTRRAAYADLLIQVQRDAGRLPADVEITAFDFTADPGAEADARATLAALMAYRPELVARIDVAERAVGQQSALAAHFAVIDRFTDSMLATHTLDARLQDMLRIVGEERKRYVAQTVNSISGEVGRLYARVHPDEPLGDPSFGLKAKNRASLTLTSSFGPKTGVPPGAYYSESHLDTLGLCVYLALAKQAGDALIVLDDVLTSLDAPHLDRVIALINDEADSFGQVIITTHARSWFERMGAGVGMEAELVELDAWGLTQGMRHRDG